MLGLLFATEGEALIFNEPTTNVAKNERIGYLPEESYLYKFLNAEETLHFYGRLFKISAAERNKRVGRLIDMVGLTGAKHRQLREYSKGMQRRIGLAQALINNPELILLDEPTSGLDPIGTSEIKQLIRELREQGKTIVLSGHLLADMQDICDRIAILHRGELKEIGRVSDLLTVQDVTQIKVRNLGPAAIEEIRDVIHRHGGARRGRRPPDDDPRRAVPADRSRERPAPRPAQGRSTTCPASWPAVARSRLAGADRRQTAMRKRVGQPTASHYPSAVPFLATPGTSAGGRVPKDPAASNCSTDSVTAPFDPDAMSNHWQRHGSLTTDH